MKRRMAIGIVGLALCFCLAGGSALAAPIDARGIAEMSLYSAALQANVALTYGPAVLDPRTGNVRVAVAVVRAATVVYAASTAQGREPSGWYPTFDIAINTLRRSFDVDRRQWIDFTRRSLFMAPEIRRLRNLPTMTADVWGQVSPYVNPDNTLQIPDFPQ